MDAAGGAPSVRRSGGRAKQRSGVPDARAEKCSLHGVNEQSWPQRSCFGSSSTFSPTVGALGDAASCLSDLGNRSEHGGRVRPDFPDFEAHSESYATINRVNMGRSPISAVDSP